MARKDEQPSDFIEVTDPDGATTRVTLQSFEEVWKEKGYKRATKAESSGDSGKASQSSK